MRSVRRRRVHRKDVPEVRGVDHGVEADPKAAKRIVLPRRIILNDPILLIDSDNLKPEKVN
jgi:hypothetical protein